MQVRSNISQVQAGVRNLMRQVPFVNSLALNLVANDFQKAEQQSIQRNFTLRQPNYVLNTVKRKPGVDFATKENQTAAVRIDETRDVLAKHETTHEKVAIQGKPYVAVPSTELRRNKRGLIPKKFFPSSFKPFVDHPSGITTGEDRTVIVPTKGGNRLLLQRFGGSRGKHGSRALFLFVPSVTIHERLHFYANAIATARSAWGPAVRQVWQRAIRTSR